MRMPAPLKKEPFGVKSPHHCGGPPPFNKGGKVGRALVPLAKGGCQRMLTGGFGPQLTTKLDVI